MEESEFKFTGFRLKAREWLAPKVVAGTSTIIDIQKHQCGWKTFLFNSASLAGSQEFFLIFFPCIIFGFGYPMMAGRLLQRVSMGIYVGNWLKDYLCLPRPPCPPVIQLNHLGRLEFGFPSTHGVIAICLPLYILFSFVTVEFDFIFVLLLFLSLFYMFLIAYSRLYLGMHSPVDIIGGLLIGILMLVGGWIIDYFVTLYNITFPIVPLTTFLIGASLMLLHPEPCGPCPCFEDSAIFIGSTAGFFAGISRCKDTNEVVHLTPLLFFLRWFIGSVIVFLGRALCKPLVRKLVNKITDNLGYPRHSFIYASSEKGDDKPSISPKWNVDIVSKYIIYYIIVEVFMEVSPQIFTHLDLW